MYVKTTDWLKIKRRYKQNIKTWLLPFILTISAILLFSWTKYRLLEINGLVSDDAMLVNQASYISVSHLFQFLMPIVFTALNFYLMFNVTLNFFRNKLTSFFYLILLLAFDGQLVWHVNSLASKGLILPIAKNASMVISILLVIAILAICLPVLIHRLQKNIAVGEKQLHAKSKKIEQLSTQNYRKIISINQDSVELQTHQSLLERLNLCIDKHIDNPELNSQKLAEYLFMSEKTLRRKIIELSGLTPAVYLRQYRLDYALKLSQTNDGITKQSLAIAVGFKSFSYFNRLYNERHTNNS